MKCGSLLICSNNNVYSRTAYLFSMRSCSLYTRSRDKLNTCLALCRSAISEK